MYNNLIEFGVPMKRSRLIKMCLNENYSKVRVGKHLSAKFSYPNFSKTRGCFIAIAFQLCFRTGMSNASIAIDRSIAGRCVVDRKGL
jgi:hypothetical protein